MLDKNVSRRDLLVKGGLATAGALLAAGGLPRILGLSASESVPHKATLTVDFGKGQRKTFPGLPGRSVLGLLAAATNWDVGFRSHDLGIDITSIDGIAGMWRPLINGVEVGQEGAAQAFPEGAYVEIVRS